MIHSGRRGTASRRMAFSSSLSSVCVIVLASFAGAARLRLDGEPVADTAHGMKVRGGFGIALEAFAQAHYEVVDRARQGKYLVAPDAIEYLFARHDVAGPVGQHA